MLPPGNWQVALPPLASGATALREPAAHDLRALIDLLSVADASRFGLGEVSTLGVLTWIERAVRERRAGVSFTYVITRSGFDTPVGLVQVRRLDGGFDSAECEATLLPSVRGSGTFIEAARALEAFAFGTVGIHRLEVRVPLHSGRANGALRKIGAVEEGILRRASRRGPEYVDQMLWSVLREEWHDAPLPGPTVH